MDKREEIHAMKLRSAVLLARHREASERLARLLERLIARLHAEQKGSETRGP